MAKRNRSVNLKRGKSRAALTITHPNAAGIDIGSASARHCRQRPRERHARRPFSRPVRELSPALRIAMLGYLASTVPGSWFPSASRAEWSDARSGAGTGDGLRRRGRAARAPASCRATPVRCISPPLQPGRASAVHQGAGERPPRRHCAQRPDQVRPLLHRELVIVVRSADHRADRPCTCSAAGTRIESSRGGDAVDFRPWLAVRQARLDRLLRVYLSLM